MSKVQNNEQVRLARMESICNQIRGEMDDVMRIAYDKAVEEKDEDRATELARKIRDRLLDRSDKEMSLDRIGLDTSSTTAFLASLANIIQNSWAVYRQHLRDITEQEGFPFNIDWGVSTDAEQDEHKGD